MHSQFRLHGTQLPPDLQSDDEARLNLRLYLEHERLRRTQTIGGLRIRWRNAVLFLNLSGKTADSKLGNRHGKTLLCIDVRSGYRSEVGSVVSHRYRKGKSEVLIDRQPGEHLLREIWGVAV